MSAPDLVMVVPRYGTDVVGGAETGARSLSTRLVADLGWQVQVLTTCALEASTWENHFDEGRTEEDGIEVHRFSVEGSRHPEFAARSDEFFRYRWSRTREDELRWIDEQGPVSRGLIDAVTASDAERIAFYPYLYHPTVVGLPLVRGRGFMHPAAHDEAPLYFSVFQEAFDASAAFVFHSGAEADLVNRLFPTVRPRPQIELGLGVEAGVPAPGATVVAPGTPYLLCLGRVDEGKGVHELVRHFAHYKRLHPGDLKLVVAGPVVTAPPDHPDVVLTGPVSEADKWRLLTDAAVLVSPSPNESFSLVILEAWLADTPVMVFEGCRPTLDHARTSGGGVWFRDASTFVAATDLLVTRPDLRAALARAGRSYVESTYAWPVVVDRYRRFLDSW
ncbi:MAG: glycosyltransferase family 4 protein [Acidimicrobiales bacterium]